jgi:hypothetical protein
VVSHYRGRIRLSEVSLDSEDLWNSLLARLDRERPDLGAVMGDAGNEVEVVLSTSAGSSAEAARQMVRAVLDQIDAMSVDIYPSGVRVLREDEEAEAPSPSPMPHLRLVS